MPAARFPYTVTLQDGTEIDAVAGGPDLIRMETRFGVCWSALLPGALVVDGQAVTIDVPLVDDGKPVTDDNGKAITVPDVVIDSTQSRVRFEYVAFMAWSALRRARDERIAEKFETFVEDQLADVMSRSEAATDDVDEDDPAPEGLAGSAG